MLDVEKSTEAQLDLIEIYAYLYDHANERTAERFVAAAERAFDAIAGMPEIGTSYETGNPDLIGMRWWPVSGFYNYLVFYKGTISKIEIIRVLHGARNITAIFKPHS